MTKVAAMATEQAEGEPTPVRVVRVQHAQRGVDLVVAEALEWQQGFLLGAARAQRAAAPDVGSGVVSGATSVAYPSR